MIYLTTLYVQIDSLVSPQPLLLCSSQKVPGRKRMPLASELVITSTMVTTSPNLIGTIVSRIFMSMFLLCQLSLFLNLRVVGRRWSSIPYASIYSRFFLFFVFFLFLSAPLYLKSEDVHQSSHTSEVTADNYNRRVQSAEP